LTAATAIRVPELRPWISAERRFDALVAAEFAAQLPARPRVAAAALGEADLANANLPPPVERYIRRSGAVGRPRPWNVRLEFEALMWRAPGQPPMRATSVQYNFFDRPTRLFLMKARMFGLPVRALHVYRREQATFTVRVASLKNIVDQRGAEISRAETVTVLNDMSVFSPGALLDSGLAWEPVDDRSARVVFTNGPHVVSATLIFNERDELVDFWSDDRPEGGSATPNALRWSTPLDEYGEFDGLHLAGHGRAVYARPDGPFTYGDFRVRAVAFDVIAPTGLHGRPGPFPEVPPASLGD
jgi:hypothetical protein